MENAEKELLILRILDTFKWHVSIIIILSHRQPMWSA